MDVRFYDKDFNLIHIEPLYKSINHELKFNGMGTFEMCVPLQSGLSGIIYSNDFLVAEQKGHMALITTTHLSDSEIVLYGRTLNFLLEKRVSFPFEKSGTDAVEKVKELVTSAFEDVIFESEAEEAGESEYFVEREESLLETVCSILEEKKLGHSFTFDLKRRKWVFRILKGREEKFLLSESLLNMYAFEKSQSVLEFANCGYYYQDATYMGTWDAHNNNPPIEETTANIGKVYQVLYPGERFGEKWETGDFVCFDRADGKVSKRDNSPSGFYVLIGGEKTDGGRFECFINEDNLSDALKAFAKIKKENRVVAKVRNVTFGKDYFLGDRVILCKKAGETIINEEMRITGVSIWQQNADEGEMPVFTGED